MNARRRAQQAKAQLQRIADRRDRDVMLWLTGGAVAFIAALLVVMGQPWR